MKRSFKRWVVRYCVKSFKTKGKTVAGRVAKKPVLIPSTVDVSITDQQVTVKGKKGQLSVVIPSTLSVLKENNVLQLNSKEESQSSQSIAGTMRALLNNMVVGVTDGFTKKLELVGIGYRAQTKGSTLDLAVGLSHPVQVQAPAGVTFETPSQTEILIKGPDKQVVGQMAARIRQLRPPEPYKGKGIRYAGEVIHMKETKKK